MQTKRLDDRDVEALEEVARDRARTSYLPFVRYTFPTYRTNWHHRLIAQKLERFAAGEIKRLIIAAPPQAGGKSELVSRRLPGYILGRWPTRKIVGGSYTADLIQTMSRAAQRVMDSEPYQELFPNVRLGNGFKKTDTEFETPQGGGYMCAGVGGGITGRVADYVILDDIIKGRKEANSVTIRNTAWEWLQDEVLLRLGASGSCLLMATRWHEDDPTGRILAQMKNDPEAERWETLILPARLDDEEDRAIGDPRQIGDPLWTWYYAGKKDDLAPADQLAKAKKFLKAWEHRHAYGFASLGQQKPAPKDGDMFKVERITIEQAVYAKRLRTIRYWDKGGSEGKGKYTAGVKMSKLETGQYLVEHVCRGQWSALNREKNIKDMATMDGKGVMIIVEQEPGSGGKESAEATIRMLAGWNVRADRPTGDKAHRAEPFSAQVDGGNILMIKGDWNQDYKEELRHFPGGTYSDQVDGSSGAFNFLSAGGYNLMGLTKED